MLQHDDKEEALVGGEIVPITTSADSVPEIDLTPFRRASLELLQYSNIARVVCVDDCYLPPSRSVDEVVSAINAGTLDQEDLQTIASFSPNLDQLGEPDLPAAVAASLLQDGWSSLGAAQQEEIFVVLDARIEAPTLDEAPIQDVDAASRLRALLGRPDSYLTLTLQEWRTRKADLLSDKKSTLIFFDRDFSREGATSSAGEDEVRALLSQLPDNWRVGLLTHTVVNSDDEFETWVSLNDKFEDNSSRFLVIAKGRLAENPQDFPRMLKLTLLAPALDEMKRHVQDAVESAWKQARKDTYAIDPYTLEAALTGDRVRDGVWGPETLLRVTSAFIQDRIRAGLRGNPELHKTNGLISSLNRVKMAEVPDYDRVRRELAQIERLEYYESPAHLNELYFPIEVGDIFAIQSLEESGPESMDTEPSEAPAEPSCADTPSIFSTSDGVQYVILLAQPCDLAIRSDGKRSNNLEHARVAPLLLPQGRVISQPGGPSATSFDLPFFNSDMGTGVEVKLSRQRVVPLNALDMCAFNPDGRARLRVGASVPEHVLPNWQKRFAKLQTWAGRIVQQYADIEPEKVPKNGAQLLTTALVGTGAWPELASRIVVGERAIHYGLTRVTRLREPYRSALLTRMAQREARDAFDPSLLDKAKPA